MDRIHQYIYIYMSASLRFPRERTGLAADFNASSAVGRLMSGCACDYLGPLNVLFLVLSERGLEDDRKARQIALPDRGRDAPKRWSILKR